MEEITHIVIWFEILTIYIYNLAYESFKLIKIYNFASTLSEMITASAIYVISSNAVL